MFLEEAFSQAKKEAELRRKSTSMDVLVATITALAPPPSLLEALTKRDERIKIIAEIKKASPSAGTLKPGLSIKKLAREYENAGASAISVLTCEYAFGGCLEDLTEASISCALPVLRKDFISDEYQVLESKASGASAILLISEALSIKRIRKILDLVFELDMDALVEAHTIKGLERAIEAGALIIGINNRDLKTLEVDLSTTERLISHIPKGKVIVSESGIRTEEDVKRISETGVHAMLIGEELMRAKNPASRLEELVRASEEASRRITIGWKKAKRPFEKG